MEAMNDALKYIVQAKIHSEEIWNKAVREEEMWPLLGKVINLLDRAEEVLANGIEKT